MSKMH